MVVLRYWQLFHGKLCNLKGKQAREQVLKYCKGNTSMVADGTGSCDEEQQKKQIRSRTALTRKGSSSRMLGNGLRNVFTGRK